MNNEIPHKQIIDAALSQIGSVADVNTVIGQPMTLAEGVTVIPFSKVSVGFASGGADFDGKNKKEGDAPHFAGGNGAGVSVTPLGFLVLEGGQVRLLDGPDDLELFGCGVPHSSSPPSAIMLFLSRRFSSVRSATHSFRARASRRRS